MPRAALVLLLLRRLTLRHWRDTPGQSTLLILILGLGVAVYLAIRLATRAAAHSFQNFTELVTAESDWILRAPAGELPESALTEIRNALGTDAVHILPVLESTGTRPPAEGESAIGDRETFRVLGLDLVGIQNLALEEQGLSKAWFQPSAPDRARPGSRVSDDRSEDQEDHAFWHMLRDPRTVFISEALARRDGLQPGSPFDLVLNEAIVRLEVAGIVPSVPERPAPPANLLVMDLPALQHWTGRRGLTQIELRVSPGPRASDRRADLRARLADLQSHPASQPAHADPEHESAAAPEADPVPPRWILASPAERREAGATMTRAFRLNLTLLSLLALAVGLYLVVQALDGAVVRRRAEIALLRSLGVTPRILRATWIVEAAALGLAGGAVGVVLGWLGAQLSVRLVGRTVNALYYATSAHSAALRADEVAIALVLSVSASVLAGWWPAQNAARTPPAQLLGRHAVPSRTPRILQHPALGLACVAVGLLCTSLPPLRFADGTRFPLAAYAAALCWIVGAGILGGGTLSLLARGLSTIGRRNPKARLATSRLIQPSGRHVLATSGLVCAVAMTAGMMILVGSFDRTMRGWIRRTFQSDLYVSSAGAQSASTDNRLNPATWRDLLHHPAVAEAQVLHGSEIQVRGVSTVLAGADFGFMQRHVELAWVEPPLARDADLEALGERTEDPAPALASESFSERFAAARGSRLNIPTPAGPKTVRVAAVFADYGNERGSLVVDRRLFTRWFHSEHASGLVVRLRDPLQAEGVRAAWLAAHPGLQVFTNAALRDEVLRIFRQTFAITYALEIVGLAVAVLGLAMTLASVLLERRDEWTTLRAIGMTNDDLARLAAWEGWIVGLSGVATGLAASFALGWLLVHRINKQTFGWTLESAVPALPLGVLAVGVLAAALAVGHTVGRWTARLPAEQEE